MSYKPWPLAHHSILILPIHKTPEKPLRSPQTHQRFLFVSFQYSKSGLGNHAHRFQDVQGWHPKRSLPSGQAGSHLSPPRTFIPRAVPFEWIPGADADLRDKWAHPEVQMWGLATELTAQIASLIDEPGQLVCSTGWEHSWEMCLPFIFLCVTIHPIVVPEHSGAQEANHP